MSYSERYFTINNRGGIQYYGGVGNPAPVRTRNVSAPSGGAGYIAYGSNLVSEGGAGGSATYGYGGDNIVRGGYGGTGGFSQGGNVRIYGGLPQASSAPNAYGGTVFIGGENSYYGGDTFLTGGGNYSSYKLGNIRVIADATLGQFIKVYGLPSGSVGVPSGSIYRDSMDGVTLKAVP